MAFCSALFFSHVKLPTEIRLQNLKLRSICVCIVCNRFYCSRFKYLSDLPRMRDECMALRDCNLFHFLRYPMHLKSRTVICRSLRTFFLLAAALRFEVFSLLTWLRSPIHNFFEPALIWIEI